MALIKCSECGKEISSKAFTCPFCGNPINERITTTQQTSKHWKLLVAISSVGTIFGLLLILGNFPHGGFSNFKVGLGLVITFFSIVFLIFGKIGAWWTNE